MAAYPDAVDHRSVQCDRSGRHAQPPQDLRVPSRQDARTRRPARGRFVATLARRAYRQPVSESDLARILKFYEAGRQNGGFEAGIELALERILASPKFVFRSNAIRRTRLQGRSIASAISIWRRGCRSSCGAAFRMTNCSRWRAAGKLNDPAVLDAQTRACWAIRSRTRW